MLKNDIQRDIRITMEKVRAKGPMISTVTNTVTREWMSNVLMATGSTPAIVNMPDEALSLIEFTDATYIDMGTILPEYEETLLEAAKSLHEKGHPWVLDPVFVGVGSLRTKILKEFKEYKPSIVRGNPTEIMVLADLWGLNGGVPLDRPSMDPQHKVIEAETAAVSIARYTGGAVAVSGEIDLISDGEVICQTYGGSHYMRKITGTGCSLAFLMASYLTCATPLIAAIAASNAFKLAGTLAQTKSKGPGTFRVSFLDELYRLTPDGVSGNRFVLGVAENEEHEGICLNCHQPWDWMTKEDLDEKEEVKIDLDKI